MIPVMVIVMVGGAVIAELAGVPNWAIAVGEILFLVVAIALSGAAQLLDGLGSPENSSLDGDS